MSLSFGIFCTFDAQHFQSNLTSQALEARSNPSKRPFVLTRSFFAGSQRFGAMWTGDNLGTWEHMTVNVKMVLANGIAGMTFAGCTWPISSRDDVHCNLTGLFHS